MKDDDPISPPGFPRIYLMGLPMERNKKEMRWFTVSCRGTWSCVLSALCLDKSPCQRIYRIALYPKGMASSVGDVTVSFPTSVLLMKIYCEEFPGGDAFVYNGSHEIFC